MPNIAIIAPGPVPGRPTGLGRPVAPTSPRSPAVVAGHASVGASSVPDTARITFQAPGFAAGVVSPGRIVLGEHRLVMHVVPQVRLEAHSFSPTPGTPIYVGQAISFVVASNTDDLTPFVLKVDFPAIQMWEVAFDSKSFSPQYEGSTAAHVGTHWQLTVIRKSGWPSSPTFSPIPVANVEIHS